MIDQNPDGEIQPGQPLTQKMDKTWARFLVKGRRDALSLLHFDDVPDNREVVQNRISLLLSVLKVADADSKEKRRIEENIITARNILYRFISRKEKPPHENWKQNARMRRKKKKEDQS